MAIKHQTIQAVRGVATANTASKNYLSGAAIVDGAPLVFDTTGRLVEFTDTAAGPIVGSNIVGFSEHAVSAAGLPIRVVPVLPGQRFQGSLTNVVANATSDTGANALALTLLGDLAELHKDATTLKWVLGVTTVGTGEATGIARIMALIDKVGATTNDTPSFGAVGTNGPNSGLARVEFHVIVSGTIF